MAMPKFPSGPKDPNEITAKDVRFFVFYLVFALTVFIIASFGEISEV